MTEKIGKILVAQANDARLWNKFMENWKKNGREMHYTKYQIKESDMRVKTATFTSPDYVDLTTGLKYVLINSKYHENFSGIILDVEYDPSTRLYSYQCQDWSRLYIGCPAMYYPNSSIYDSLIALITKFMISDAKTGKKKYENFTAKDKKPFKPVLSGLRPLWQYNQSLYKGNKYKGNPFKQKHNFLARNKTFIELIRDLVFSQNGYFDVWFNDKGILQIEPLSKTDWETTGLHLAHSSVLKEKYKFSTTNAITRVRVNGTGTSIGEAFDSKDLLSGNLDLSAFFGHVGVSISDPTAKDKNTSNATKNKSSTSTNTNTSNANYRNTKIWIGADGGSGDICREIVSELEKNGWTCHYSGEGAGVHNSDYENVTSDYAVLGIVDNGFCCTTVKEAYEGYAAPILKRKNVRVMFMFDTREWSQNRYGDFNHRVYHTAYDDPSGYCTSMDSTQFFLDHNATYCCAPDAKTMVEQFLAGGICK